MRQQVICTAERVVCDSCGYVCPSSSGYGMIEIQFSVYKRTSADLCPMCYEKAIIELLSKKSLSGEE